jgi:hypothetical protein
VAFEKSKKWRRKREREREKEKEGDIVGENGIEIVR